jgi:hypothetical protein
MKRMLVVAAAAFLIAGPIALAQPNQTPPAETPPVATPTTPPVTQPPPTVPPEPATPATPATPPTPGQTPATPATPATPSPNATQPIANPQGCRTRKEAGEPCACRSDPSRIGVSTASETGQNICVRPD